MKFNIKTKLYIGLSFLIAITLFISSLSAIYIYRIADESKEILKDNYESVLYAKSMMQALDNFKIASLTAQQKFNTYLQLQEQNITEVGEAALTTAIKNEYKTYVLNVNNDSILSKLNQHLYKLMDINMQAIIKKNNDVQNTIHTLLTYISISIIVCIIAIFVFLFKFPAYIANPIKELDLAKTNFIATISHELKTPIASIKLSTQLLEDHRIGAMNEEQKKLIHHIKDESDRLLKITSEVLNMAQVETGTIQLNFQQVEPEKMIEYAVAALKFQLEQKGIQLVTDQPKNLPKVNADIEKTAWVMVNLLSNAIRYSPTGAKIIISIYAHRNNVQFSVQDFGKGIEAQYQEKIFDKYFQIPDNSKTGTGLGLAIAKEFIAAQNGTIGLQSKMNEGSTFYFTLPCV